MSELHAATALASFDYLEERIAERNRLAERYRKVFGGLPGIDFPVVADGDRSTYKDLTIVIDPEAFGMDAAGAGLRTEGIQTRLVPLPARPPPARLPVAGPGQRATARHRPGRRPRPHHAAVDGNDRRAGRRRRPRPGPAGGQPGRLSAHALHRDPPRRRVRHRARADRRRARLLRAHLVPRGVRRPRAQPGPRPGQPLVQPPQGTLRGMHYQARPPRGGQARALHPGGDLRRHRRPAPRLADVPGRFGAELPRRQPDDALRARRLRPRLPDPGRRHRGRLPDVGGLRAAHGQGRSLRRSRVRHRVAGAGPR